MTNELRIAVILLSYNRPKMLEIAHRSIIGADRIILVDDGSDAFNPREWAEQNGIEAVVAGPPRSLEDRMYKSAVGALINEGLRAAADCDIVAYLCDDDLFTPQWLPALRRAFREYPGGPHVVRGRWRTWDDPLAGGVPMEAAVDSYPANLDWRKMTTGNFAHRTSCFLYESIQWSEDTVAVHDDTFIWAIHRVHNLKQDVVGINTLAGYRRSHNWNMANYTAHGEYAVGAEDALRRGALE